MGLGEVEKKPCLKCRKRFLPRREWQKWCSAACRVAWYRETIREGIRRDSR